MRIRTVTLPAATSTKIWDKGDSIRGVVNIGTGLATMANLSPAVAGTGWPLAAANGAGDQGGGFTWDPPIVAGSDMYAISTAGTTLCVMGG